MKSVFAHSYSLHTVTNVLMKICSGKQFSFYIVHARTRMIVDSCYSSGAGSEFHVDGPATAKLRGPYSGLCVSLERQGRRV